MRFLRQISKRKLFISILVFFALTGGIFLLTRQIFKADTDGFYTISGQIYSQDTKKVLADAEVSLSSSSNLEADSVSVKTDASGRYSISAPSSDFVNISITKDGYWDIDGIISSYNTTGQFILNLDLKPGFGKEDTQIIATKAIKGGSRVSAKISTIFGVSLEPFDKSPASLVEIIPQAQGDTYTTKPLSSSFIYLNQQTGSEGSQFRGQTINFVTKTTPSSQSEKFPDNGSKTIVIRGRAKTEATTFQTVADKNFYLADPFMTDLKLADIQVKDEAETYSFFEAKTKGLIDAGDPINLDSSISQSNVITFKAKKSVELEISKSDLPTVLSGIYQNVEIPAEINPADVLKIAEHNPNFDTEEKNRLEIIDEQIDQVVDGQISAQSQKQLDYLITLTKNGKRIVPEVANPQNQPVSHSSLPKAQAQEDQSFLQINVSSFYLGDDKDSVDTLGLAAAEKAIQFEDTIKGSLGEPIITNPKYPTVSVEKIPYWMDKCGARYEDSRNTIMVDTECPSFKDHLLPIFLHEIGHSWRGNLSLFEFGGIEEGLAEVVPLIIHDQFDSSVVPIHSTSLNYEDTLKRSYLIIGNDETDQTLLPYGSNMWSRGIPAFTFYKVFLEDNQFLKELHEIVRLSLAEKKDLDNIDFEKQLSVKFIEGQDFSQWFGDKINSFTSSFKHKNNQFLLTPLTPKIDMPVCHLGLETLNRECVFNNTDLLDLTVKEIHNYEESWTEVANKKVQLNFYSGANKLTNVSSTQETHLKGEILLGSLLENMKNSASGPYRYLAIKSEESLPDDERAVVSQKIFYKNGSFTGHGMFGTADVPDGTNIILDQINPDNSTARVASVPSSGETYEFPSIESNFGRYKISIPTLNYSQQINKWKGIYNFNIKTDKDAPVVTTQAPSESINYSLNEPASTFIEYGDSKGFYSSVSFGKSIGINLNEGDEVKTGSRIITLEGLTAGQTYHYRLWAIDRSGNVSHTDDQTFSPDIRIIEPGSAFFSRITKTSSHFKFWGWWPVGGDNLYIMVKYGISSGNYSDISVPVQQEKIGNGTVVYHYDLAGLSPGTRYFFRIGFSPDANPEHAGWGAEERFYTLSTGDYSPDQNDPSFRTDDLNYPIWCITELLSWCNIPIKSSSVSLDDQLPSSSPSTANISSDGIVTSILNQDDKNGTISYQLAGSVVSEIQYGTFSSKFSQIYTPSSKKSTETITLPNLKNRTYYYRIATTDDKGNITYSPDYKLKHGNWFVRFFGDRWEWFKSKLHR